MFAGVVAALRGDDPPELDHHAPARITHPEHSSGTYRFCTNFAVTGSGLSPGRFIEPLEELGDSVLVVGDTDAEGAPAHRRARARHGGVRERRGGLAPGCRRHAPAGRRARRAPGAASGARSRGEPSRRATSRGTGPAREVWRAAALAVVSGEGLAEMFRELGVHTIDGGPTLNPSTYDLLAAIHEVPAEEVVVLPNSANVIMAAEHAAQLSDKQVLVAPTTSQQAGLAAAVALAPDRSVEENAQALSEALARVRTGAVAPAARDDAQGRFTRGEAVGFVEDEVLAWGEPGETLRRCSGARHRRTAPELISVLAGEDAPLGLGTSRGWSTAASSSSCARAASPPTGGCSRPSSPGYDRRRDHDGRRMPATRTQSTGTRALRVLRRANRSADARVRLERSLSGEEMIGAPLRWPRPARLREPLELPAGKARRRDADARPGDRRELLEHLPTGQPRGAHRGRAAGRRAGDGGGAGAQRSPRAPVRRRGMRPLVEATVFDATGSMRATFFNQPWLVQRYPRDAPAAARQGRRARRFSRLPPRPGRLRRCRGTGGRPGAPAARARAGLGAERAQVLPARRSGRRPLSGGRGRHLDADPHARAGGGSAWRT